jgi:hypothetical protein
MEKGKMPAASRSLLSINMNTCCLFAI